MIKKDILKEILTSNQQSFPKQLVDREVRVPYDANKVVVLKGVRRCGKSSVMFLLVNDLLASGVDVSHIVFLNFDDERLPFEPKEFDFILQAYRELYPNVEMKNVYFLFDEIQMARGWEQFVRRIYENESKHIYLTGSNAKLLSSEIATSLRGRTLQYEIFPLSFKEFCQFRNVAINNLHHSTQKAKLLKECETYIFYGGFPEVVLDDFKYFEKTLQEYYFVMLYRDLLDRYNIKNLPALKYFIRRILSNVTKKTSINKIYNELKSAGINVGKTSLYEWIEYVEAVYLFLPLPKYNFSPVKELSSERKYYCIDNGLQKALSITPSEDRGNLLENAFFLHLRKGIDFNTNLYYYKGNKECDFVVCKGTDVIRLIQCSWDISDMDTYKREIDGLLEASETLNCNDLWIVTADTNDDVEVTGKTVHIRPAYLYFLTE